MFSMALIKQDFKINHSRIMTLFVMQMVSMLMAIGICEMKLIEISDIFWDTIPVIIIPMAAQMLLAYETITKCQENKVMELILSTGLKEERIMGSKMVLILGTGIFLIISSAVLGVCTGVYRLTGEWKRDSYILLNVGACCLQIFLGGFLYWMACRSRSLKQYLKTAVLFPVCMYVIYLIYYWVQPLFFLKFVTVFSLYRQQWYAKESVMALIGSGVLLVAGIIFLFLGNRAFYNQNLPE